MDASKKQRVPVAFKSLAELKRFIRPGVEFKTVSHANHADMVGLTRVVTTVQTVGFYSKIKDQPEHPFSTCNHGKGFYTEFGKAGNYIFDGTTVKVKDARKQDRGVIYELEFYDREQNMEETMMDRKMVDFIKEQYPPGTRIRLNSMEDPYAPIRPGTEGEVDFVDDAGSLHMKWDNGRSLALIPGEDSFTVANVAHFGKVSKLSYNAGRGLSVSVSGYSYRNPSQSLPKIISTSSSKASIAAIRSYFTDEQVIRSIAGYAGMDFDTLIGGDYKLVVEPLAYLCYNGQQFAMTATEAALYDQVVNGDLRKKLGTLTHKNLPLAIFLEEADLGYTAWSGSRTEKASNGDIISSLGIGIVRFNEVTTPPEPGEYDYEYRVNTEVITSVEVRGGQSDPDNPVSVRFNIQGRTYTVSNVYYPDGDSQLAWVRWRTPAEPCVITISVSVYGGGSAQGTITCNIVDLDGNDPPNPLADDRNNGFRLASVPEKEQVTSASWGIWSPWWQENWEWVENWQKCWHTDRWTDADGKTHRDRWYHWVDNGWWEDHGWWEFDYNGYSASLTASMRITPDEKSPTATASTLKSGYGVQEKVTAKVTTNQSAAVTAAQNAVTYFPEFGYENYWRLLEAEISGRSTTFQFKANPYSTYNRRTHFTPIWYPDGSYTPYTWLLDCWTPAGMLSMNLTDSVTIRGNLWEEWHIAPAKQR